MKHIVPIAMLFVLSPVLLADEAPVELESQLCDIDGVLARAGIETIACAIQDSNNPVDSLRTTWNKFLWLALPLHLTLDQPLHLLERLGSDEKAVVDEEAGGGVDAEGLAPG